jgi:rifampicin phosphotransferase
VLVSRLECGSLAEIQEAIAHCQGLRDECTSYLEKFGERTFNELKLESLTLHDDPLPLYRGIAALARQYSAETGGVGLHASSAGQRRLESHRRVEMALSGHPFRRFVFSWVLRHARRRVRDRENLRLERTRLFGRVRRIFLEIGRRLYAGNRLDDPRHVFLLAVDEVLAFAGGRSTTTDLRGLVAVRMQEFAEYREGPAPADRFETRGPAYIGNAFTAPPARAGVSLDERQGLGCCPGVVRGRVQVVADPAAVDLQRRSILVAEHTDPGWIMVFPSARGVLVQRGSLLSHAAIVARELGIPAIVSIPSLTTWLQTGDWVEMDGATGVVRRVAPPETGDAE